MSTAHHTHNSDDDYMKIVQSARALRENNAHAPAHANQHTHTTSEHRQDIFSVNECPLCKIALGEVSARLIHQSSEFLAFLDIMPKAVGHVTVITRRHARDFESLTDVERSTYADFVADVSSRMKPKLSATGYVVISPVGQSAGHITDHFVSHILPTYGKGPDLPVMNILQPQRVPEFVMDDVKHRLTTIGAIALENKMKQGTR